MIEAIKYNLGNLTNFNGRDARPTFWWYVLFIVVAQFIVGLLSTIPLIIESAGSAIDAAQSGATPDQAEAAMMESMVDAIGTTLWVSVGTNIVGGLLLLASFVRRLHDSGNSGYWAAIPVATLAASTYMGIEAMDRVKAVMLEVNDVASVQQFQADVTGDPLNYINYIGILVIVVFGLMKSQEGANKYGEHPVNLG